MSLETFNSSEFTAGVAYTREKLLDRVFKLDLDVAQDLINRIEAETYDTPSFEAGVHSYCHKLLGLLGIETMCKREETEREFGVMGMHRKLQLAYDTARELHAGQKRKNSEMDYFEGHLVPVARAVSDFVTMHNPAMDQAITVRQVNLICAALLHDSVEDTNVTLDYIVKTFGQDVGNLVKGMTHETEGNRLEREEKTRKKLIDADWRVRLLKCFDITHNAKDLAYVDPGFGTVWYKEKIDLIEEDEGKFLEGIPPVVAESLKTTLNLGLQLSQALSAKK